MEFRKTNIEGLVEIFPKVFKDERGYFLETFQEELFRQHGVPYLYKQDNHSVSAKGVLRGLHLQKPPFAQGKLVRVATGKALDVVVDLRKDSKTLGQVATFLLDSQVCNMVYVPEGFAHGFVSLEDHTTFLYKCTNTYHKASEGGIIWNDPTLNISWGVENPLVSEKDLLLPTFEEMLNILHKG